MANLFELNQAIENVKNNQDQIDPDTLQDTLDSIQLTINDKLDSIASWIDDNQADIDFLGRRMADMRVKKASLTKLNDRLMNYMTSAIDQSGKKQIKTEHHILKPRNYRGKVVIDDTTLIPAEYMHTQTVQLADKAKLYEDLKTGKDIPGASLQENRKTRIL